MHYIKVAGIEVITISREEYERLLRDSNTLAALEAAGVDNWSGYSDAFAEEDSE